MSERILTDSYLVGYPENDYRNFLEHSKKGDTWKDHKYISRKKGKNGNWIYYYANAGSSERHGGGKSEIVKEGRGLLKKDDAHGGSGRYFIRDDQSDKEIADVYTELQKQSPYVSLSLNNKVQDSYKKRLNMYSDEYLKRTYKRLGID